MPDILISVRVPETSVLEAIAAIQPFAISTVEALVSYEPQPKSETLIDVDENLAQAIAERISPSTKQTMRREVLQSVLWHWDSFLDTQGEGDPSMRVALGSLSKSLKQLAPYMSSPIEMICTRERRFFPDGKYQGTVYNPTKLGERVREILIEQGKIK